MLRIEFSDDEEIEILKFSEPIFTENTLVSVPKIITCQFCRGHLMEQTEAFSDQILTRQSQTQTDFYFTGLLPYAVPPVSDIEPYRQNRDQNIVIEENNSDASSNLSSWDEERILEEEEINEEILNDLL